MGKTYKFILPQNKEVQSTKVRVENGEVFVDVEFKEKFDPKDGDFLYVNECGVFIYKHYVNADDCDAYCGVTYKGRINLGNYTPCWCSKNTCRYATPEEKAAFLERLEKECNKRWNAEKKCLEDVYVPKFGDIVRIEHPDSNIKYKRQYVISIFPNKEVPTKSVSGFFNIATIDMNGNIRIEDDANSYYNYNHVFLASESEKQELFDKLAEIGKRWNQDTKQLEDIRWKPKEGEDYWNVNEVLEAERETYSKECTYDNIKLNNCFKTKEAAQKVADQIKEIFKNSKAE